MNERIKKAYASAPKTWVWQLLAAFIVACLLAWSGTAVRVSSSTGNGLEVAGNILSGIFHPSAKLLLTLGTDGVPYLLLETFCIAFLGTIVGAVISLPLSFLSASNLVPRGVALVGRVLIAAIRAMNQQFRIPEGFSCIREEDLPQMAAWADAEANPTYPVPVIYDRAHFIRVIRRVMLPAKREEQTP